MTVIEIKQQPGGIVFFFRYSEMRQFAFYKETKRFQTCAAAQRPGQTAGEGTLSGPPIERVTQEPERSESVPAWTRFQQ